MSSPGDEVREQRFPFADRLKVHLRGEGIRHDVIDACFQLGGQDDLVLLVARGPRAAGLPRHRGRRAPADRLQARHQHRRAGGEEGRRRILPRPRPAPRRDRGRAALFAALDAAEAALAPALAAEDFAAAMTALARLRAPIDAFFDTTTVNAASAILRRNRLCLLNRIRAVMNRVAVFSAVEGGSRRLDPHALGSAKRMAAARVRIPYADSIHAAPSPSRRRSPPTPPPKPARGGRSQRQTGSDKNRPRVT